MRIPLLLAVCIYCQSLHLGLQTATAVPPPGELDRQLNAYFPGSQYVHVCSPAELFTYLSETEMEVHAFNSFITKINKILVLYFVQQSSFNHKTRQNNTQ